MKWNNGKEREELYTEKDSLKRDSLKFYDGNNHVKK